MNVRITPGKTEGAINVPPSKSLTQRAFAGALLHKGVTVISNYGTSEDEQAALVIIRQLGAAVEKYPTHVQITGSGVAPAHSIIHCGESGLAARLFAPLIALSSLPVTLTGKGSLLRRPMHFLEEALPQLGVRVEAKNNCLPAIIQGPLQPKNITVNGAFSSQGLTGLLFAYSFTAKEETTIEVTNLTSQPYIDLTLQVIQAFGKKLRHEAYKRFFITPAPITSNEISYTVEADWSSAAYWITAAAIAGTITLNGLNPDSLQADKAILDVLKQCGGKATWAGDALQIRSPENLYAFDFDATHCPDLFPILAILATQCKGISSIKGLNRLIYKESNRKASIQEMLTRFGVSFKMENNTLLIEGSRVLQSGRIPSFNDHRIAMAAAIAALKANGAVTIEQAESVSKSYPDFFQHLRQLHITCLEEN